MTSPQLSRRGHGAAAANSLAASDYDKMTDEDERRGRETYQIERLAHQVEELMELTRSIQNELATLKGGLGMAKWLGVGAASLAGSGIIAYLSHTLGIKP